jgi:hypothetical protein
MKSYNVFIRWQLTPVHVKADFISIDNHEVRILKLWRNKRSGMLPQDEIVALFREWDYFTIDES